MLLLKTRGLLAVCRKLKRPTALKKKLPDLSVSSRKVFQEKHLKALSIGFTPAS
jgi:hypothetical protein